MMAAALWSRKRKRNPNMSPDFVYQSPIGSMKGSKLQSIGDHRPKSGSRERRTSGFNELPAEMILQVLRYLPIKGLAAASGVCKQWRKLCKDPSLWKCVSFEGTEVDRLQWNFWKRLTKLGTTCVDLHACVNPGTSAPRKAIGSIIKLTNVNALYFGVIEKADLSTIIENMPQLKILHVICLLPPLSRSSAGMIAGEETILYDVGKISALTDLEDLKLSSVYSLCVPTIAFSGGMKALENLIKLKKLVLSNFEGIGRDDIFFVRNLPHLEHLELGNCSSFSFFSFVHLSYLENLKSFSLTQASCLCCTVPCTCIRTCLESFKKLRKLTLIMCCIPNDLDESIQELPELHSLEIWPYLDINFIPMAEDTDHERFISCYTSIFRGLDHLPSITIGILDRSIQGLYNPFEQKIYDWISDKMLETHFSRFCRDEDKIEEEGFVDKIWDRYNRFLLGDGDDEEESSEAGTSSDVSSGEEHCSASCSKLHDNLEEQGGATPSRKMKSQGKGTKRGQEKTHKMGTYDRIKYGLIDLLPTSRLTLYRVKMSRSREDADTEMFYISRKEEHYNMPTLSQT